VCMPPRVTDICYEGFYLDITSVAGYGECVSCGVLGSGREFFHHTAGSTVLNGPGTPPLAPFALSIESKRKLTHTCRGKSDVCAALPRRVHPSASKLVSAVRPALAQRGLHGVPGRRLPRFHVVVHGKHPLPRVPHVRLRRVVRERAVRLLAQP